jgi:hypothetical protein
LFEFRTHGIDPSSPPKYHVKNLSSTDKTRYKKIWNYAKENATRDGDAGGARTLVFVNKGMKFTSEEEGEQKAYLEWKTQIRRLSF